jgi:mRNA interferase MazF
LDLCQVTSNAYGDARAIPIATDDFADGGLRVPSFARPGKLFTAHETLIRMQAGRLTPGAFERIRAGVVAMFG